MYKCNRKLIAPLALMSAALIAVSAGLASASGTARGGLVHLYEADTALARNVGTVVLTGAITDYGTDCQGCGGRDGLNVLELSKGSFEINVNNLGNKLASSPFDSVTCSSDGSAAAPVRIVSNSRYDTGAYAKIRGTFDVTASTAAILRAPNGQCDPNATRYPGVLIAKGSGTVHDR